jgi:hypothetical protein
MNRSFLYGLVGVVGVAAIGLLPIACQSGGVGVPCIPEDEYSFRFSGFKVTEDIIESRSFQCATRICLVNHFQGRVSCPLGQPSPKDGQGLEGCTPKRDGAGNYVVGQGSCGLDPSDNKTKQMCMQAGSFSPSCDRGDGTKAAVDAANKFCSGLGAGNTCSEAGFCECKTDADCLFVTSAVVSCDPKAHQCVSYACHTPGDCQDSSAEPEKNKGKACCLPGTDTPVTTAVCGQCKGQAGNATRDADAAVYCSCRCGVAEGQPDDPNFNFCTCPDGFECSEIRRNVGLGDEKITGKYCILAGTAYDTNKDQCGLVDGHWAAGSDTDISCKGASSGECATKSGSCNPH